MTRDDFLSTILIEARTYVDWFDRPVTETDVKSIYDVMKWGPTSANCSPARFVFALSEEAKQRVADTAASNNKKKVLTAPVTAIFAYDLEFYEWMPELFPEHAAAKTWFNKSDAVIFDNAFRNATLQAAYFLIAARALGFDCAPMSGFNRAALDEAFFEGTSIKSNFICPFGHGNPATLHKRPPRLDFDRVAQFL